MRSTALSEIVIGSSSYDTPLRFEQRMAFGKHTVVSLDVRYGRRGGPLQAPQVEEEWTPTRLSLGERQWYGYVHHGGVVSDVRESDGSVLRYTLVGTSLPMNEERTRAFRKTTRSAIAKRIFGEHRLRMVVSPHRGILPYYGQTGTSDWRVLQDMAEQSGYRLWVDGSTGMLVDPKVLLDALRDNEIPVFEQSFDPARPGTLFSFSSKAGTLVPRATGSTRREVAYGLDARTGKVLRATASANTGSGAPTLTHVATNRMSSSNSETRSVVEAAAQRSAGWVTATAVVLGDPSITPGRVVYLDGATVPEDERGRWLVTEVVHRVLNDSSPVVAPFTSTLTLERDKYRGTTFASAFRVNNTSQFVPATIRDGQFWESEYMEAVSVG